MARTCENALPKTEKNKKLSLYPRGAVLGESFNFSLFYQYSIFIEEI